MSKDGGFFARLPVGVIALSMTTIVILWAALFFDADRSERAAIKQARSDASNLAIAFRENVRRTVSAIDQLMIAIIAETGEFGDQYQIPIWVEGSPVLRGTSAQISMSGPHGIIISSSLDLKGPVNISDRPYFRYHLDPSASQPYISAPVIDRNSGKWSLQITRRIPLKDGSFGGVIVVSIAPSYFTQFFNDVDLGQNGVIDLIGRDGIVRARRELNSQEIGQNVGETSLFKQMQVSDAGNEIVRSKLDGIERVYGYSSVPDYPLVVAVGFAINDALAAVKRQWTFHLGAGGILTLVIVILSWFFANESRRRHQQELTAHAEEQVREQKVLLEAALQNMSHGLCMFDAKGRIVLFNEHYRARMGLPAEFLQGLSLLDLFKHRKATGDFPDDPEEFFANVLAGVRAGKLDTKILESPNGQILRVIERPMAGGGWVATLEDITEERKSAAAIREYAEREQLFIAAVESSNDAIVTETLDGVITGWNHAAEQLFGFTSQEAIGKSVDIIVPDELRDEARRFLAKIKNNEKVDHHETVRTTKDGPRIDVSLSVSSLKSQSGAIIGAVKVARDISAKKKAQEALLESEQMARGIIDTSLDAFIQLDEVGTLLEWSPKAEAMFGWSCDEIVGRNIRDFVIPPENRATNAGRLADFLEGAQQGVPGRRYEAPSLRRDGQLIDTEVSITALRRGGRYIVNGFIRDITDRVQAEKDRDRNREFLDRIIENITLAILVKDARDFRYVLINRSAEQLWGLTREQVIGKTAREIFPRETADVIEENDRQLLKSKSNFFVGEHTLLSPDNSTRLVTSNRLAICDQKGEVQYILGVVEDVTDRRTVENQLRQAQKMEAIGNLTGGVAHDFNNLLTVIMGNLDLLREEVAGHPTAEQMIDTILQASERGADLTRYMLAFSRRQPLHAKPIEVNALVENAARMLSRTLGENIAIQAQTAAGPLTALVDASQLETALLNIALNARDAMPDGGLLTIHTRIAELDEDYAALHQGVKAGAYAAIEIADSGTGIAPDLLERIFEPFFTTKPAGKGTGLGLSMVYGFMKQSGGHVSAYSEVGHGTVFKLFLPLAIPVAARIDAVEPDRPRAAKSGGEEVILAVDDNPDIRAVVAVQLRSLGYQVREADCAHAALQILDTAERIDLLFTDVVMPGGLNGKELASKARAKRADLKVLFTSGFPGTSSGEGAQLEPSDVLLSKPYHKHDLAKAIERILSAAA
jgi:PAS domain S-box-containing protein